MKNKIIMEILVLIGMLLVYGLTYPVIGYLLTWVHDSFSNKYVDTIGVVIYAAWFGGIFGIATKIAFNIRNKE